MPYAGLVKRTSLFPVGLSLLALVSCKPGDASKEKPETAPATKASPREAPAQQPVPAPAPENRSANDAERALAEAFIERFLLAIEADDPAGWPALQTLAQRADLEAKNAVEKSYEAWRTGTITVVSKIREGNFALQKRGDVFTLRFVGVRVPTDPETEYSLSVAIEEGEMRISEK